MKLKNVINIPIIIFAILGGCFYRFGTGNKYLQLIMDYSPLRLINRSQFLLIYDNNSRLLFELDIVMILIGWIFTVLSIVCFKREEYGNGELPGYEK